MVKVTSSVFKGAQLGVVIGKCKGQDAWKVQLSNPDLITKVYCISTERGDTIVRITKDG